MENNNSFLSTKDIAYIGLFSAISIVLGIFENFIPTPPFMRIGLSNLGIMILICLGKFKQSFIVLIVKVVVISLLSGNIAIRMLLAFPSSLSAYICMIFIVSLLKNKISAISLGVTGALAHVLTQLAIVNFFFVPGIIKSSVISWFIILAIIMGTITGIICNIVIVRLPYLADNKALI